jgi:hypothetical protein
MTNGTGSIRLDTKRKVTTSLRVVDPLLEWWWFHLFTKGFIIEFLLFGSPYFWMRCVTFL